MQTRQGEPFEYPANSNLIGPVSVRTLSQDWLIFVTMVTCVDPRARTA